LYNKVLGNTFERDRVVALFAFADEAWLQNATLSTIGSHLIVVRLPEIESSVSHGKAIVN
jgi:hypothetical protein